MKDDGKVTLKLLYVLGIALGAALFWGHAFSFVWISVLAFLPGCPLRLFAAASWAAVCLFPGCFFALCWILVYRAGAYRSAALPTP
jgi:hypothetical protein